MNDDNGQQMYDETNPKADEKSVDPNETQELRILIDNSQVGGIIGKGGSNVDRVRTEAGVFLSILKSQAEVSERVMVLKGPYDRLVQAIRMVAELLVEADAKLKKDQSLQDGQTRLRLLVHRHAVGAIIGKAGATIKETQLETTARVQVANEPLPGSTEKTVTIYGTPQVIHTATSKLLNQLRESPLRPNTKTYPYVPGVSPFPIAASLFNPMQNQFSYVQQAAAAQAQFQHLAQQGQDGAVNNTQKIAIPTICAGCIIGKGGSVIRDLRRQSGTNISIADSDSANPLERVVTLTGTPNGIQNAIYLIRQLVEQYQPAANHVQGY